MLARFLICFAEVQLVIIKLMQEVWVNKGIIQWFSRRKGKFVWCSFCSKSCTWTFCADIWCGYVKIYNTYTMQAHSLWCWQPMSGFSRYYCTPFIIAERFLMVHFQFIMTILNFVVHYFVIDSIFETL